MRLEIGNFYVQDIAFGETLAYCDGVLSINKQEALDYIKEDDRITEADLYIDPHVPGKRSNRATHKTGWEERVSWVYRRT